MFFKVEWTEYDQQVAFCEKSCETICETFGLSCRGQRSSGKGAKVCSKHWDALLLLAILDALKIYGIQEKVGIYPASLSGVTTPHV